MSFDTGRLINNLINEALTNPLNEDLNMAGNDITNAGTIFYQNLDPPPGSATQNLDEVLTQGNDAGGHSIVGVNSITGTGTINFDKLIFNSLIQQGSTLDNPNSVLELIGPMTGPIKNIVIGNDNLNNSFFAYQYISSGNINNFLHMGISGTNGDSLKQYNNNTRSGVSGSKDWVSDQAFIVNNLLKSNTLQTTTATIGTLNYTTLNPPISPGTITTGTFTSYLFFSTTGTGTPVSTATSTFYKIGSTPNLYNISIYFNITTYNENDFTGFLRIDLSGLDGGGIVSNNETAATISTNSIDYNPGGGSFSSTPTAFITSGSNYINLVNPNGAQITPSQFVGSSFFYVSLTASFSAP